MAREKFIEMEERLQKENEGKIVLVKNGKSPVQYRMEYYKTA